MSDNTLDMKFLDLATSATYPAMTWAHISEVQGQRVLWSFDSYRVHMLWGVPGWFTAQHVPLHGSVWSESNKPSFHHLPIVVNAMGEIDTRLEFDALIARKLLESMPGAFVRFILVGGIGYAITEDEINILPLSDAQSTATVARCMLDKRFVCEALKHVGGKLCWDSTRLGPVQVGNWLDKCALIMPMAGNKPLPLEEQLLEDLAHS